MVVAAIGIATEAVVAIVIVIKNAVDAKNKKKTTSSMFNIFSVNDPWDLKSANTPVNFNDS